jgi:large subunit ribosomal protein L19e
MQLLKKKMLASKVLGVGKGRIYFNPSEISQIKEAITRQDIMDLHKSGVIQIKQIKGRKKAVKRKNRRRTGKVKNPAKNTKQEYVIITRKLRTFAKHLLKTKAIDNEKYSSIRKMIRARRFKSKRQLKENLGEI